MAKIPPIDLSCLVKLLKHEGKQELCGACLGKGQQSIKILSEWDNIIRVLENEIIPFLCKGGELAHLAGPAQKIAKSAGALASLASQILSFVPGPIGIMCSVINAIVCFCTLPFPVNIGQGMLELLGCIPGGKVAAKGGAKLAPKIEKLIVELLDKSPEISKIIKDSEKIAKAVKDFTFKHTKKTNATSNMTTKVQPTKGDVGYYSKINNYNSGTMPTLEESILMNSKQPSMIKTGTSYIPYPSTNKMLYILSTKTGKYVPYSHLY